MKDMTYLEFLAELNETQINHLSKTLQIMAKKDAGPLLEQARHIPGYVQEMTHFLRIPDQTKPDGVINVAVDVDHFWRDSQMAKRVTAVYVFDSEAEMDLERHKSHVQSDTFNPAFN